MTHPSLFMAVLGAGALVAAVILAETAPRRAEPLAWALYAAGVALIAVGSGVWK